MTERIKYIHVQRSFRFPVSETTQGVSETMRRRNDRSPTPLMRLKVAPKQRISLHAATYCRERTGKSGLDKLEYGQISNTKQGGWARLYVSNEQTNRIAVVSPGLKSIRPINTTIYNTVRIINRDVILVTFGFHMCRHYLFTFLPGFFQA